MLSRTGVILLLLVLPVMLQDRILLALPVPDPASAHEIKRYITNQFDIKNQNWNICQNPRNGMIYFANSEGLVEYNGLSSKIYYLPYRKGARSVMADRQGTLFTGSFEEFGYWNYDPTGQLIYHSLAKNTKVEKNDEIWKIYASGGKIYFQSFTTVYCYDYQKVYAVKAPFTMLFMFQVGERFIVQILDSGLYWFDGKKFSFIPGSELLKNEKIHTIIPINDGSELLIGTAGRGLYQFSGQRFTPLNNQVSSFLQNYTCNAGVSLNDSLFAFGTISNGIIFSDKYGHIINHYNYSNGLNNNAVLSLYKDLDNGLWIGLDEGVNYVDAFSPYSFYTNSTGTLGTIYAVLKDNRQLYLGTNHGLFVADITKTHENYEFGSIKMIPNSQGQVWTLEKFDNQIICGHNDGTYLVGKNSFKPISQVTGGWAIKPFRNYLLEGTYTGLVVFTKDKLGNWKFRNKIKGFQEPTRHLEIDYLGYVWASHLHKGIYKLELNEALDSVVKTDCYTIAADKPLQSDVFKINNTIAFTTSEEIYTYDYDKKAIVPFSVLNSSLNEFAKATQVIPYTTNFYWFIQDEKIALFEISRDFRATCKTVLIQESFNLPEHENQIIQLDDKVLLFPTRQAFSLYNLGYAKKKLVVSWLQVRKLSFTGKGSSAEFSPDLVSPVKVPYRTNNVTVYFADASRFYQLGKEYFYKVEEVDENWHKANLDNFTYLNLKPGTYHLKIRSDISGASITSSFTILKPWYLTWLAFVAYFLLCMGLVVLCVKIFKSELKEHRKLLEFELNKKRLESELDYKTNELMLSMRFLIQKNDILNALQTQIDLIKENSSHYPIRPIRDMEHYINEGLKDQTEEWSNALSSLKLSQQGFFKKLKEKHPDLTPHDLRLCLYLRMNFTTKEIAKLINISTRGVEISRYRLRKKMNLDHITNLTEYLIGEFEE